MEWINIKEKTPKKGEEVLVWCERIEGDVYYEVNEPSCAKVFFNTLQYSEIVDCDYYNVVAYNITHWMPLPKTPIND